MKWTEEHTVAEWMLDKLEGLVDDPAFRDKIVAASNDLYDMKHGNTRAPDTAQAELLREAERALVAFVPFADQIDEWGHEDDSTCTHRIPASALRRARATLAKIKGEG